MTYANLPKWTSNVLNVNAPHHTNDISETVDAIFTSLHAGEIIDFNTVLVMSCPINPVHLCVALRATYSVRDRTRGWHEALNAAKHSCGENGIDVNDALYGMLDVTEDDTYQTTGIVRQLIAGDF